MKRFKSGKSIRSLAPIFSFLLLALPVFLTRPAQAQEEFKYGAVMPVTGPIPMYGQYSIRGSQLALEDLEKSGWIGGKKVHFLMEDGKNDPKISLSAMNKLISIDKVEIVESVGSSVLLALGPVAQENKVLLVNNAAQNPLVRKMGSYTISMVPLADQIMDKTVAISTEDLKANTATILQVNNEYGRGVADTIQSIFEGKFKKKIVLREIYAAGETDFTTTITKAKFAKADVIFLIGHENDMGYAIKKGKQMGIKCPWIFGPGVFSTPVFFEIAGSAAEGIRGVDFGYDPENGSEKTKAFVEHYKKKFGGVPSVYVANTYDSMMLYAAALKSGARTSTQIRDYYLSVKGIEGVSGPLGFDKDGITTAPVASRQFLNGRVVTLKLF